MRLSKYIAQSGYCSRREADKLIENNLVLINKNICNDFSYNVKENDIVTIHNKTIKIEKVIKEFGLNKPKGYITSTKDEKNRPTVYELLPAEKKKLIYIGRLDFNSEGLLLFTNNGDFSRLLEIPKSKIIRSYKVKVRGELKKDQEKLSIKGLKIENVIHKFKKIKIIEKLKNNTWYLIDLEEGKNREIRKVFSYFNISVIRIIRTNYGKYSLKGIKKGQLKQLDMFSDLNSFKIR